MDFKTRILSNSAVLMEGALGERLKREYFLEIEETIAMASLIYEEKASLH